MKIQEINSLISTLGNISKSAKDGDFDKELSMALSLQNQKNSDDLRISNVDEFRSKLVEYGSYGFLNALNAQKINDQIEQKRQELKEFLTLNDVKNLTKDQIANLDKILEDMLADYKKELMARFENNSILEKAQNLSSKNGVPNFTLSDLINLVWYARNKLLFLY